LTISAVVRLLQLFPVDGKEESLRELYNEVSRKEMEHVRDFIILHYHATQRDEPMWKAAREMEIPESLAIRLRAWRERAHAWQGSDELFRVDSWTHVLLGQGIVPAQHHPLARGLSDQDMRTLFDSLRKSIADGLAQMSPQHEFIAGYC